MYGVSLVIPDHQPNSTVSAHWSNESGPPPFRADRHLSIRHEAILGGIWGPPVIDSVHFVVWDLFSSLHSLGGYTRYTGLKGGVPRSYTNMTVYPPG